MTTQARRYPSFRLLMGARAELLNETDGVIQGYRGPDGLIRARLVVGADGRFSRVRELAHIARTRSAQPIGILWFVLPSSPADPATVGGLYVTEGGFTFIRNRGDHWQIAYMLPKGGYQRLRAAGLELAVLDAEHDSVAR